MTSALHLGLDTFGEVSVDDDGHPVPQSHVIRDIVVEGYDGPQPAPPGPLRVRPSAVL